MEPLVRNIENIDWVTVILFSSLILIAIAKGRWHQRFLNFIILPFNNKYIFLYNKKDRLMSWFHIFFTIFQLINFSLFTALSWKVFFKPDQTQDVNLFIFPIILGSFLLFFLLKMFLQLSNAFIFKTSNIITQLIFKRLSYLNYSSIIMFIANVTLTYIAKDSKPVVGIALFLIISINVIGWTTALRNHQKFIANNLFYFILYLCTLEIAPWVIIGSYLND